MPTTEELQEAKQRKADLKKFGIAWEPTYTSAPTAQWYRADGTALPNLLPADPYHIRRYEARGWTMFPPSRPAPVPDLNETAAADVEAAAAEPIAPRRERSIKQPAKPRSKRIRTPEQVQADVERMATLRALRKPKEEKP